LNTQQLKAFLRPTEYIESAAPEVVARARSLDRGTARDTAIALFAWARDHIRDEPYACLGPPSAYHASAILARQSGYCVQKAVLLAALGRAAGIPTRLGFADVRNHKTPAHLREAMGTDLYVFHGFVEFYLDGAWVKATPAFDAAASRKAGILPVQLDGSNDAMLHPVDPQGHPFIEYVRERGSYADLPMDEIREALHETYGFEIVEGPAPPGPKSGRSH